MLELQGLTFAVHGQDNSESPVSTTIIDDLDLTFEKGRFYAITGPNGGGKTTLSKLIMGIHRPTAGRIVLDGEDITDLSVTQRARKGIAYSFQHPARFKGMTFRDLLSIAAGTSDEETLVKILARVGICSLDFLDKPVDAKLSGGEIKKIELATTIARKPRFALYDEPDTGIDLWTIGPMLDLLQREAAESGTTTVVVSHNEKFLRGADEILLLREGRVSHRGTLEAVLPLLKDLNFCDWKDLCEGESDVRCHR